ncbi:hypothetical protein [Kribbella amoyensis]|uniref:hypothetical protein n=1 Tax=Kribbella amoyensis TaxID=996641 RepID=UPI0011AA093B|nr:hypothetical protein [Kribbella amoyensis]
MPGNEPGSEWAAYHRELAAAAGYTIDTGGPNFGWEHFVEQIAEGRAPVVSERNHITARYQPYNPSTHWLPDEDRALLDPVRSGRVEDVG